MARLIAQRDLRNQNAGIGAAVAAGERFVITRHGIAVAELRPLAPNRRIFVPKAELAMAAARGPHLDASAFRHDLDSAFEQRLSVE